MRRLALLIVLCSALAIAGCSAGSSKSEMAAVSPAAPEMSGPAAAADSSLRTAEAKQSSAAGSASNAGTAQQPAAAQITAADQAGFQASDTADGLNRKIMYKANLVMKTDNYVDASEQIQNKVALSGGYILQFNENVTQHERGGTFTIKVPSSGFSSLLKELENISPATQRSVQGQDVSEEYVDLTSRMKAKQVVEARLLEFMGKAAKTDELLAFSNELAKVQEEIERMKGRMRFIDQNVAMSTVELRLYQKIEGADTPKPANAPAFGKRIAGAFEFSTAAVKVVLQGIIVFLVGAIPVAVVIAVVYVPVFLYMRHRRKVLSRVREQLKNEAGPEDNI